MVPPSEISPGAFLLAEYRTKKFSLKIEDDAERTVTAKFATLGVEDLDGDVIEKGSVGEQNALLGAWNHSYSALPPGAGQTYETKDAAMFTGSFFETESGEAHYRTLKAAKDAGYPMEWSFRFFVEEGGFETRDKNEVFSIKKMKITHVAPVESGAGIDTQTVEIKSCGPECQAAKASQSAQRKGEVPESTSGDGIDYAKLAAAVAAAMAPFFGEIAEGKSGGCSCGSHEAPKSQDSEHSTDDDGEKTLGELLGELRDAKEMTNEQVAEAAGISAEKADSLFSPGAKDVSITELRNLAKYFEVSLSDLATAAEKDGEASDSPEEPQEGQDAPTDTETSEKSDGEIWREVSAILQGREVPVDIDPDVAIWQEVLETITVAQE